MIVNDFLFAITLATFAGLSTTFGSVVIYLVKNPSPRLMSLAMGFSAGVMIAVAIFELIPSTIYTVGVFAAVGCFLLGMVIVMGLDFAIPHDFAYEGSYCMNEDSVWDNYVHIDQHQYQQYRRHNGNNGNSQSNNLYRTGTLVAIGITLHNLPEGMATMMGSIDSVRLGFILAIAIAIHNIPEGLSIAMPIYGATHNRRLAFKLSFISGFAEPIGGIIGYIVLIPIFSISILHFMLAAVAGVMIFISFDELLPSAREACNTSHNTSFGIILGIIVMAITIILLS